jgi:LysR family transcriptional regulator, transcriptional activator for bauABCD operon
MRVLDVDLKLLRVFQTVVAYKSFSGAQTELNLSAASISGYISALEERMGTKLCQRGRAGFALTEKGELIHAEAVRLLAAMDDFAANAGAIRGRLVGTLKIGVVDCTVTDPNAPLTDALRRFGQNDHHVRHELTIQSPQDLQRGVLDGKLHLAIGSFPSRISALRYERLYTENQLFYCGRGHPLFDENEVSIEQVRLSPIVARGYWRRADLGRIGVASEAAMVDSMEAQAILIRTGAYVGFLPAHYARGWEERGELRCLLPEKLGYPAPFDMILRRGAPETAVLQQIMSDLRSAAAHLNPTEAPRLHSSAESKIDA